MKKISLVGLLSSATKGEERQFDKGGKEEKANDKSILVNMTSFQIFFLEAIYHPTLFGKPFSQFFQIYILI